MTNTGTRRNETEAERAADRAEETRRRIKEKLYKAKACGELDEDDEAMILAYATGVVTRRGRSAED